MWTWKTKSQAKLGPLTQQVLKKARWQDSFPSYQELADEFEDTLRFLEREGQFGRFLTRLRPSDLQRDAALAEILVAYYFSHYKHFSILSWEPQGSSNHKKDNPYLGEFEISKTDGPIIFVEVKAPNWRSELSSAERANNRDKLPKSFLGQTGSYNAEKEVLRIARDSMHKFRSDCPNLLVVVPDLKVSPFLTPEGTLKRRIHSFLGKPESVPLDGLLLFEWNGWLNERHKKYRTYYFDNPLGAGQPWGIPNDVKQELLADSSLRVLPKRTPTSGIQPQGGKIYRRPRFSKSEAEIKQKLLTSLKQMPW